MQFPWYFVVVTLLALYYLAIQVSVLEELKKVIG